MPLNRNIGNTISCTISRSWNDFRNDVTAIPTAANPNATSKAAGSSRTAHTDAVRPRTTITIRKPVEYSPPRIRAQPISPIATSSGPSEVASIESYSFAYLILKNTFMVES